MTDRTPEAIKIRVNDPPGYNPLVSGRSRSDYFPTQWVEVKAVIFLCTAVVIAGWTYSAYLSMTEAPQAPATKQRTTPR